MSTRFDDRLAVRTGNRVGNIVIHASVKASNRDSQTAALGARL
jgi:hypothetical protein